MVSYHPIHHPPQAYRRKTHGNCQTGKAGESKRAETHKPEWNSKRSSGGSEWLNSSGRSGSGKFTKSGCTGARNFKAQFAKKILQFEKDPFHPSLKTHTLGGGSSYYRHKYYTSRELLSFMKSVSRIILDPSVLAGKPVIRGTWISVDLVLELLASG